MNILYFFEKSELFLLLPACPPQFLEQNWRSVFVGSDKMILVQNDTLQYCSVSLKFGACYITGWWDKFFRGRISTNQTQELVVQCCQWNCMDANQTIDCDYSWLLLVSRFSNNTSVLDCGISSWIRMSFICLFEKILKYWQAIFIKIPLRSLIIG